VHDHAGAAVRVSALLFHALEVAYSVAERTHGAVDPTVGNAINALGYDEDLSAVQLHAATPPKESRLCCRVHAFTPQFCATYGAYPSWCAIGSGFFSQSTGGRPLGGTYC
jgi:hypothetical protein